MVVVVVFATLFVFLMSRASGDPRTLYLSEYTTQADWDKWGEEMGLDKPIFIQYITWFGKAMTGEFGTSLRDQIDAFDVIKARIPATLKLSGAALFLATIVGVPLGVLSAVRSRQLLGLCRTNFLTRRAIGAGILVGHHADHGVLCVAWPVAYLAAGRPRTLRPAVYCTRLEFSSRFHPPDSLGDARDIGLPICRSRQSQGCQ